MPRVLGLPVRLRRPSPDRPRKPQPRSAAPGAPRRHVTAFHRSWCPCRSGRRVAPHLIPTVLVGWRIDHHDVLPPPAGVAVELRVEVLEDALEPVFRGAEDL